MMVLRPHAYIGKHFEIVQNLGPHQRMSLNQAKFHIRQLERLVKHSVRDADLTHIMQHGHIINVLNLFLRPAQTLCQKLGVRCHPHGVSFCVIILRIHRIGDRHNRLNGDTLHLLRLFIQPALQVLTVTVQFYGASRAAQHDIRLKGLGNVVICAHAEAFNLRLRASVRRQKDNRYLFKTHILLQCLHYLKAADFRHINIKQNQVGRMPLQILISLLRGIHGHHLIFSIQQLLGRRQRKSVIINN